MAAVYNAEKKELVALFKSRTRASIFIFGFKNEKSVRSKCLSKKRILDGRLGFEVAVRDLTQAQENLLDKKDFILYDEKFSHLCKHGSFRNDSGKLPEKKKLPTRDTLSCR